MTACPICQTTQETNEPCQPCKKAQAEARVFPNADGGLGGPPYLIEPKHPPIIDENGELHLPYTFGYPADDDPDGAYECYLDFGALNEAATARMRRHKGN